MANRLADIFADLESQLIANQRAVFQSYPNSSLSAVENFQMNMRTNQSMLEQVNVQAVSNAYRQAISYMNDAITKGYNRGVTSVASQLETDINNEENERARALKSNANSVIASMCRIAISSAMGAFSGIVSAVSVYNQAQDLYQAIDQAQSQYLEKGVVGSVNTNGAQTNIETFADIVEGEFDHNATLTGEGHARDETGNYYVVVSSHFGCCEKCAKWENVVLIDDWKANGKPDGVHPLLSEAVSQGLLHPNCRHRLRVPFKGEEKKLKGDYHETWTAEQNRQQYQAEQKQRRYEREIRKYKRLEQGSLTQSEQLKAHQKVLEYQKKQREHIKASNQQDGVKLFRQYEREQIGGETKPQLPEEYNVWLRNNDIDQTTLEKNKIISHEHYNFDTFNEDLKATEEYISTLSDEHSFVFTKDGEVYGIEGKGDAVDPRVIGIKHLKDAIITHNHPYEEAAPSKEDVKFLFSYDIKELRTVDKNYLYILKFDNKHNIENFEKIYKSAYDEAGDDILLREIKDDFYHLILMRLKTKIKGLGYERYKR